MAYVRLLYIENASQCINATRDLVSILFITPCMSYAMINVPFAIAEFSLGLALFFSMPTTLSSGPIITG